MQKNHHGHVLVGIGTSTGGPRALKHVIPHLQKHASYFIVQHMPKGFTQSLAERLNVMSQLEVKEAEHGEIVRKGVVYIAPGGLHMKVVQNGLDLQIEIINDDAESYRPSVDVLFESMSKLKDYEKIAVIMTGMGSDGTIGLKKLKASSDVTTIAQSEQSSIIFGMPKSAIEANTIDYIVDLKEIPHTIQRFI
ncbi:CheB methylesterase domain-containing protein [Bacillus sp. FJAT-47783]|uniref:CheB methylesterase domain-containing protein n=1 Tax=Bacillus sp. FJAT-47783 TaxID=2922712 RepID=UPI001FAC3578|nr:CheB methylesterase domain-containing protein [Bacillus sp. FJAT-47783]